MDMYENGELKIYCNVYLPSISDEIDINKLAYNDKWALDQINRLKSAIKEIEDYRIKLFEQSQKIRQSTTHKLIELKREKNYSANKIFYYATLYEVYDDFKNTYYAPNKKILEQTKIIVRRQKDIENGDIAVMLVDNENATIKQFFQEGTKVTLVPRSTNPKHTPQFYDLKCTQINILGKVVRNQIDF